MSMGLSICVGLARQGGGGVSAITDATIAALLNGVSSAAMLNPGVGMYQDMSLTAAGNGDPLGLWIDVSQMGGVDASASQPELNDNTWPNKSSEWVDNGDGSFTITNATGNEDLRDNTITTAGNVYRFEYTITGDTLGVFEGHTTPISRAAGTYTSTKLANTNFLLFRATAGETATVSNISVREIPGHHAIQETSSHKPAVASGGADLDGVDDHLEMPTLPVASMTGHTVLAQVTLDGSEDAGILFNQADATNRWFGIYDVGSTSTQLDNTSGTPAYTISGSSYSTRSEAQTLLSAGSPAIFKATSVDLSGWTSFALSNRAAFYVDGTYGKLLIMPDATYTANQAIIDTWMAS